MRPIISIGFVTFDSFGAGIPTDNLALRVHHEDRVVLDSVKEHPIIFFAFPERLLRKPASALHLRQMLFRRLVHADVADRCRHQNSFGAFQRAQHDLDGKLGSVLPPPVELDPGTDLLRQRVSRASGSVGDQPFREALRNDVLHLLPDEFIAQISELFLRLNIQQDDFPALVHHHHGIRSRLQQPAIPALHLRQMFFGSLRAR